MHRASRKTFDLRGETFDRAIFQSRQAFSNPFRPPIESGKCLTRCPNKNRSGGQTRRTKEPLSLSLSFSTRVFDALRFHNIPQSLGRIFRKHRRTLSSFTDNASDVVNPAFLPGRDIEMSRNREPATLTKR